MIKADKYYIENLNEIFNFGSFDENPRPKYKDGVPAYTQFIDSVCEKYDISKGEFPITTLRNTAIKTGIKEILWIYQKQTKLTQINSNIQNIGKNKLLLNENITVHLYSTLLDNNYENKKIN